MALETIGCSMLDVGCWMFSFGSGFNARNFRGILSLNLLTMVGRVTPCAPSTHLPSPGAHGVTGPTLRFMERQPPGDAKVGENWHKAGPAGLCRWAGGWLVRGCAASRISALRHFARAEACGRPNGLVGYVLFRRAGLASSRNHPSIAGRRSPIRDATRRENP